MMTSLIIDSTLKGFVLLAIAVIIAAALYKTSSATWHLAWPGSPACFGRCRNGNRGLTFNAKNQQHWKIDKVDLAEKKPTSTLQKGGKPVGESKLFDLTSNTTVFRHAR